MSKNEIFLITCDCGEKFSHEKYYQFHLDDVKEAKRLLKSTHKRKLIEYKR